MSGRLLSAAGFRLKPNYEHAEKMASIAGF